MAIPEGANSGENINNNAENSDERGNEAETPANNEERVCSVAEPRSYGFTGRLAGFFSVLCPPLHLKTDFLSGEDPLSA